MLHCPMAKLRANCRLHRQARFRIETDSACGGRWRLLHKHRRAASVGDVGEESLYSRRSMGKSVGKVCAA